MERQSKLNSLESSSLIRELYNSIAELSTSITELVKSIIVLSICMQ